jgi:hypothetical protein
MNEEEVIKSVDYQLLKWCESIREDINDFFNGNAIKLNNKVMAMSELNNLDRALLRKYVYIYYMGLKARNEEEIRKIRDKRREIVRMMLTKRKGGDVWIIG